jgi:CBS domain-containing protein
MTQPVSHGCRDSGTGRPLPFAPCFKLLHRQRLTVTGVRAGDLHLTLTEGREATVTVGDLMKTDIGACAPGDELVTVLLLMRDRRCGWAPVVDSRGVVVGVITDRDAAMAMLNHPTRSATRVSARDAMSGEVIACAKTDAISAVLGTMAGHHVRRLPVLDERGHLQGVISIDDIVRAPQGKGMPKPEVLLEALRAIVSRPTVADATS